MFLARPGRKKATATKPRIYYTYSLRSSIHFLARCSVMHRGALRERDGLTFG